MTLENKGLQLIRTYEQKKAQETLADDLGAVVGFTGGIATFLYLSDLGRNENTDGGLGMSWQPSWTPGYEVNHDEVHQWAELGYLAGYVGVTIAATMAARKIAKPIAKAWKEWRYERSGVKQRDEEFNANYQMLADRLITEKKIPTGLHQDYQDALHFDHFVHSLSGSATSGITMPADLLTRYGPLVPTIVKEHVLKVDYSPATAAYMKFLSVHDLFDVVKEYLRSGRLDQVEPFIDAHLRKPDLLVDLQQQLSLRENLAEAFYQAGRLADAERVWKVVQNKEKLKTLSAAYRNAGDKENAARTFAEHWS